MSLVNFNMISSGSRGNSTLIWDEDSLLIIDFGITLKRLNQRINDLGIKKMDTSLLISHEHTDHSKGVLPLSRKLPLDIYTRELTSEAIGVRDSFDIDTDFVIGNFRITAFDVSHDASDPVGFTIRVGKVKISVVSDLGYISDSVMTQLKDSDLLAIEANHDVEMLRTGSYPEMLKRRILSDHGHLSNYQTAFALEEILKPDTQLVLTHLSQENNTPEVAHHSIKSYLDNRAVEYASIECASQDMGSALYTLDID